MTVTALTELGVTLIPMAERLRSLRMAIKASCPVDSGDLKKSWNDPLTVQARPDGSIEIDNPLPYARIQDQGGTIPPYDIIAAKGPGHVMRATINGQVRYFTSRKEIVIKPQHYVQKAINQWQSTPAGVGVAAGWTGEVPSAISVATAAIRAALAREAAEQAAAKEVA